MSSFQKRVAQWVYTTFGQKIQFNVTERRERFIEESLELVQALKMPKKDVLALVDYVYNRPDGEVHQEIGGVLVTLHALGEAIDQNIEHCGEVELERCWDNVEKIREKQRTKPRNSPLPE